ncbi:P-loop containing nucleoside triphosphate hydrolase protein [Trichocladium antarcticum]|uniref:P-loop containing nucleoside triphosphate hydrolase protein n=1 Tax=Trichocladium antarcticum TaxID=1450529 RepID=A0AAN6UJK5_9PEZI|nr:P-loop containing nucleoside triphosphate hydrolase protein [Trichocladium antarcticum]
MDVASLSDDDIVIAVMGVTGSGKSTFISLLAAQSVRVGHSLASCTADIGIYSFSHGDRTVHLIDTPGFDDTSRSDTEILKEIAFFLAALYARKVQLAGIIHLHRITDPRIQGSALKSLHIFQQLCGERGLASVVLATTMWAGLDATDAGRQTGQQRLQDLQKPEFWGGMLQHGSRIARHDGTAASARAIVASLLADATSGAVLDIQVQLVDERRTLDDTAAGQLVQAEMRAARRRFEADLREYQAGMELALQQQDRATLELLRREREDAERRAARLSADSGRLRVSLQELAREKGAGDRAQAQARQRQAVDDAAATGVWRGGSWLESQAGAGRCEREGENRDRHRCQMQQLWLDHRREAEVRGERMRAMERQLVLVAEKAELERQVLRRSRRTVMRVNPVAALCQGLLDLFMPWEGGR